MKYCDCSGPEDVDKPPIKRGNLPAVHLKPRTERMSRGYVLRYGCKVFDLYPQGMPGLVPQREANEWVNQRKLDRWLGGWRIPA